MRGIPTGTNGQPLTSIDPLGLETTGIGFGEQTENCLEDLSMCHMEPEGECEADGVTTFCDQAQIELEMGSAEECPSDGCQSGQIYFSPFNGEIYHLKATMDGYAYTAPNGEWVDGEINYSGELGLPPPNLTCELGGCNGIRFPWPPPPAGTSMPPRPTAQVKNPRTYSRSYAAYVACGVNMLAKSEEATVTANGIPLFLLAKGREIAAAEALWYMGAYDFSLAGLARINCGRAVYGYQ